MKKLSRITRIEMKSTFFLAAVAMTAITNVYADEKEYNDFLTGNNFQNCKANITPQDLDDLFNYVSPSEEDYTLNHYKKNKDLRTSFAIRIAECQQKPLHMDGLTCAKTMLTLDRLSKLYWLWQTAAQRKAAQAVTEYNKNITHINAQIVDFDTKAVIAQVARSARQHDNPSLPVYKPRLIQASDNRSFMFDEDVLYNQLIACTDASKSKKDCIAGLKDHAKINSILNKKGISLGGSVQIMAHFCGLGNQYLQNNVHGITSEEITR